MPVKLTNISKSPFTLQLCLQTHKVRTPRYEYEPNSGRRHTKRVELDMPDSVHLAPGASKKDLALSVLDEPDVKKRIALHHLQPEVYNEEPEAPKVAASTQKEPRKRRGN